MKVSSPGLSIISAGRRTRRLKCARKHRQRAVVLNRRRGAHNFSFGPVMRMRDAAKSDESLTNNRPQPISVGVAGKNGFDMIVRKCEATHM
jgi:hypothetical protein